MPSTFGDSLKFIAVFCGKNAQILFFEYEKLAIFMILTTNTKCQKP